MLSNEWSSKGVNVNVIVFGYVVIDMNEVFINNFERVNVILLRILVGRWGKLEDFKVFMIFFVGVGSLYVLGEILIVDGGWMGR